MKITNIKHKIEIKKWLDKEADTLIVQLKISAVTQQLLKQYIVLNTDLINVMYPRDIIVDALVKRYKILTPVIKLGCWDSAYYLFFTEEMIKKRTLTLKTSSNRTTVSLSNTIRGMEDFIKALEMMQEQETLSVTYNVTREVKK